jgi:hypothetical protein
VCLVDGFTEFFDRRFGCDDLSGYCALLGGIYRRFVAAPGRVVAGLNRPDRNIRWIFGPGNRDVVCLVDGFTEFFDRRFSCDDLRGYRALLGGGLRSVAAPGRVFPAPGFVAGLDRPDRNIRCIFRPGNRDSVRLVDGFTEF